MKTKQIICMILLTGLVGNSMLFSQETAAEKENFSLAGLIEALEQHSGEFRSNEASLKIGLNDYLKARASLLPAVSGSLPLSFSGAAEENITPGINSQTTESFSAGPQLSVSQILPTAGVLSVNLSDTISSERLKDQDPSAVSLPADPVWSNGFRVSAGLSQPLYFKNAYKAARDIAEETYSISRSSVLDGRNRLVLGAVEDFYRIQQARFSLDLIKSRLESDRETYKRVEKEFQLGLVTRSVLYQAQSAQLQSETDLLEAEQELESLQGLFSARYGLTIPPETAPEVELFTMETFSQEELIPEILARNPDASQLRSRLAIGKATLITTRKDQAPVLSLSGTWNRSQGLGDYDDMLQNSFSLSLEVSASLFDGGKDARTMDSLREEQLRSESALADWNIQLENQVRSLLASLERSGQLARLNGLKVEAATYEYRKGLADLELGQITKKELTELRLGMENALLSRQQNIINTNTVYLQLMALRGQDLRELPLFRKEK